MPLFAYGLNVSSRDGSQNSLVFVVFIIKSNSFLNDLFTSTVFSRLLLNDAVLLTICYTQHSLRQLINSEMLH